MKLVSATTFLLTLAPRNRMQKLASGKPWEAFVTCKHRAAWPLCAAALGLCATLTGCGADTASRAQEEVLGSPSEALRCGDGTTNPDCIWKANWAPLKGAAGTDMAGGHYSSPAVCVSNWNQGADGPRNGWLAVSVDQNSKYEVLAFNGNIGPNRSPSWSVYGSTKRWNSRPACTDGQEVKWTDGTTTVGGFLIAGKVLGNTNPPANDSNNNKIFASAGRFGPWNPSVSWPNPTWLTAFEEVDPDHRSYSTGGLPALASNVQQGGFGAPSAVLVFMGTDLTTIFAHTHALPYATAAGATSGAWSKRITGPTLPCDSGGCWKVSGTPTIVREVVTFHILVHAVRGGAHRLYQTYFYSDGAAGHFSQFTGGGTPVWSPLTVPMVDENTAWLEGDPWITYDPSDGNTLYFQQGHSIWQTSFSGVSFTASPQVILKAGINKTFVSSPAAKGGVGFDDGYHVALGVADDKALYYIDSLGNLVP